MARSAVSLIPVGIVLALSIVGPSLGSGRSRPAAVSAPSPPEVAPVGWGIDGIFRPCHFVTASVPNGTDGHDLYHVAAWLAPGPGDHTVNVVCAVSYGDAP